MTSISAITVRAALFQRRSRAGWLEELDGIREEALVAPDGPVDDVVAAGDIWTDLREGGVYADPHEISSLYATDETPDQPIAKAKAPKPARQKGRRGRPEAPAETAPEAASAPPPPPAATELPPPPPPIQPVTIDAMDLPAGTDVIGPHDAEPMWVQPAPHPIRPSEMWHPAELAPPTLGGEVDLPAEERLASAELVEEPVDPFSHLPHRPVADPAPSEVHAFDQPPAAAALAGQGPATEDLLHGAEPIDHLRAVELESELAAAAELTVLDDADLLPIDTPSAGGLVPGPVGRRVRRDRPPLPQDGPTDEVVAEQDAPPISTDRGDRSPLPEPQLPPAALPARPAATTPVPSVAEVAHPAVDAEPAPVDPEPAAPAPAASATIAPEPEPVAPAPEPEPVATMPEPVPEPEGAVAPAAEPEPEPLALTAGADGLFAVPATIVRQGGGAAAVAVLDRTGAHVELGAGWIWASPGDGQPTAVHVALPTALASVAPGATALTVVEPGGTCFVFVADGTVELRRPDGIATLGRGSIAMLAADGGAQVDQASDAELAADPIVAENLALDAEL